jgi:hypothetical protein
VLTIGMMSRAWGTARVPFYRNVSGEYGKEGERITGGQKSSWRSTIRRAGLKFAGGWDMVARGTVWRGRLWDVEGMDCYVVKV